MTMNKIKKALIVSYILCVTIMNLVFGLSECLFFIMVEIDPK